MINMRKRIKGEKVTGCSADGSVSMELKELVRLADECCKANEREVTENYLLQCLRLGKLCEDAGLESQAIKLYRLVVDRALDMDYGELLRRYKDIALEAAERIRAIFRKHGANGSDTIKDVLSSYEDIKQLSLGE